MVKQIRRDTRDEWLIGVHHKTQVPYLSIVTTQQKYKKKARKALIDEVKALKVRINDV